MHRTLVWSLVVTAVCLSLVAGRPSGAAERRCRPNPAASSVWGRALCPFTLSPVSVFGNVKLLKATLDSTCSEGASCGPEGENRTCIAVNSTLLRDDFAAVKISVAFVCVSAKQDDPSHKVPPLSD
ncbi:hypothetical protein FJT64_016317 [Amphibalanus amphitrite]|uniref:Uncharacterized protein n=1 Tax=Amphibalanus amphitrite TaxID=1232801 RepID=A0A6A4X464_AMPAM|nr:hypothetical protein FJT64_016317 [Amphibalanus amphitrite]